MIIFDKIVFVPNVLGVVIAKLKFKFKLTITIPSTQAMTPARVAVIRFASVPAMTALIPSSAMRGR